MSCEQDCTIPFFEAKLTTVPLSSIKVGLASKERYAKSENTRWLATIGSNTIKWVHVDSDRVELVAKLPAVPGKVHNFEVSDTSSFIVQKGDVLLYKLPGSPAVNKLVLSEITSGFQVVPQYRTSFIPEQNTLILLGIANYQSLVQKGGGCYDYIGMLNLKSLEFKTIDLKTPEQYCDGKLGVPHIYVSSVYPYITISFEFEENVYIVNMETLEVDSHILTYGVLNPGDLTKEMNKFEKNDRLLKRKHKYTRMGKAFFDPESQMIYRMCYPPLPSKKKNGEYFQIADMPIHTLSLDIKTGKKFHYVLPAGYFYVPDLWEYDVKTKLLTYVKTVKTGVAEPNNRAVVLCSVDCYLY